MMFRLRRAIAKKRIKRLEYLAFINAGIEIPVEYEKAQALRERYGLKNWSYEIDY